MTSLTPTNCADRASHRTGEEQKAVMTTLRAEIDADAWASYYSESSRPFPEPNADRNAVKVVKVFKAG